MRTIVRLTRQQQRVLEDILEKHWDDIERSRFSLSQIADWVRPLIGFPANKGHIAGALVAIGKAPTRKHGGQGHLKLRPVVILMGQALASLASRIPGMSAEPTLIDLRAAIEQLLEEETKPEGGGK